MLVRFLSHTDRGDLLYIPPGPGLLPRARRLRRQADSDIRYYGLSDWDAYRQREAAWLKKVVESEEFRTAPVRIVLIHMIPEAASSWYGEQQIRRLFVPELVGKGINVMLWRPLPPLPVDRRRQPRGRFPDPGQFERRPPRGIADARAST